MDRYELTESRRALILCDTKRSGAEHDVPRMEELFKGNGFDYTKINTLDNRNEVMTELSNFQDKLKNLPDGVSCLMVVIMCHGRLGHISLSDGKEIQLEEIYQMFYNRQCPALREKPKLFVVQACRGVKEHLRHLYTDGSTEFGPSTQKLLPTESDIMVVYAVCPEKLAIIHPEYGCPLFVEMEKVFKDFSTSRHMYELFTKVNRSLDKRVEKHGFKLDTEAPRREAKTDRLIRLDPAVVSDIGRSLHIVSSLTKKWYL
ncbi:caspase-14-like [Salvelinus alpinus]|uniref:caspase-14-like n=1 Tax=Salvelinus alpinus TaxID=8036 RepID=UPI0039FC1DE9